MTFRGIYCEGRTQYVTNSATVCVKLVTPLDGMVEFRTCFGDCSVTLEFTCKARPVWRSTFVDAQTCLQGVTRFLQVPFSCLSDVQLQIGSERITNGPEGTVANNTMQSCNRLLKASEFVSPDATNAIKLQSLLTLAVENLYATTKMKHPAISLQHYFRDCGKAMRESIKGITTWSTEYFTHRKSYYPIPKLAMDLSATANLNPIPVVPMDKNTTL